MPEPLIIRTETEAERDAVLDMIQFLAPDYRGTYSPLSDFRKYSPCWCLIVEEGGLTYSSAGMFPDAALARPWPKVTIGELRAALGLDKPAPPASWPGPPLHSYDTTIREDGSVTVGCSNFEAGEVRAFIAAYQQHAGAFIAYQQRTAATALPA